jgi:hypothetical protein
MRSWRRCSALVAVVLVGGCGGTDGARAPAVSPAPTPPDTETLKYDLLTAEIQLDAYKLSEGTFTADETLLGAAFPDTVTVKEADASGFDMAAYDNRHIRYELRRTGDRTERTCKPPDPKVCPDGEW